MTESEGSVMERLHAGAFGWERELQQEAAARIAELKAALQTQGTQAPDQAGLIVGLKAAVRARPTP